MSYSIFYDCKLIQYKDKFMVDLTTGANNGYELSQKGRWVRERYRYLRDFDMGKIFFTKDEILSYLSKKVNENFENIKNYSYGEDNKNLSFEEFSKNYGWYTSVALYGKSTRRTSLKMYQNFFMKAFKKPIQYNSGIFIPPYWKCDKTTFINSDNIEAFYQQSFK